MDFQAIRKEYEDRGIDPSELDVCPLKQLELWMQEATSQSPGDWFETNAMALATAGSDGIVSVRVVLLKGLDRAGLRFYTNYDSHKGQQLAANANCSAVLHWPYQGRQVRVVGTAAKTPREDSESYFHSRPYDSQLGAAVSAQSSPLDSRAELESRFERLRSELDGATVPLPENWGGYLLTPTEIEFWQGRTNRLHDRVVYRRSSASAPWTKTRLAP